MRVNLWGESGREAALLFYVCGSVVRLLLIARYGGVAGAMQGSGILVRKTHRANSNDCLPCVFIDNTIKNWSRYFINWRVAGLCLRLSRRLNTLLRGRFACLWSAFVRPAMPLFVSFATVLLPLCSFCEPLLSAPLPFVRDRLCVLERSLVRYGQLLATLCATCSQHLAAIGGSHSCAESVLVDSLTARWLECSLHCHNYLVFIVFTIPLPLHKPCGLGIMRSAKV